MMEKDESSRSLLDKLESEWDSPPPPRSAASPEVQAALDAAAARLIDSLSPPPISVPTMDELDSGWDEEDEDEGGGEEGEEDEVEPELPDERVDPVAYAVAKAARDGRVEARRQKRRAKAEAKKARRATRLEAQRAKQKGKQKKARPAKPARPSKEERARVRAAAAVAEPEEDDDDGALEPSSLPPRSTAKAKLPPSRPMGAASKPMLSKTNQWMLAVAVVIFLAAAIFAAVVAR